MLVKVATGLLYIQKGIIIYCPPIVWNPSCSVSVLLCLSGAKFFKQHLAIPILNTWKTSSYIRTCFYVFNSSWPSATYMRRDFQCLFPQRPRYVALISVLISPVPHTWGVTNGSLLASPPNSRRSPASLISPAPHICGASRTPILTRVVWKY